ncbi:hypothetical protein [Nocardioides panaciterrulae]|uniref:GH16 domain-containing protein n=1 Tax=Nocardioides panaciterrulae TaxID=661492 RepID=A0A7Y9E9J1_9ACTN|nr:hypothetical protein [Nocardioides panaciterrulae]NYD43706.1 hypothetical protein [Nocardioides panaciterrulae]
MSMPVRVRAVSVVALAAFAPALAPAVAPGALLASAGSAVAATTTGSLSVTPARYIAGQAVRFRGHLGNRARAVHLQSNMNRPGDTWVDVPDSAFRTDDTGDFDFSFRAPAMFNLSYRVVAGGRATPSYLFTASPQELTLTPLGGDPEYPFYRVPAGTPFTAVVDTTPSVRGTFGTPPPIPGRTVTLQERTAPDRWETIGTGTTDADGRALFTVTAPASGTEVLRARQERWTEGGSEIGWFASFPAYFAVSGDGTVDEPSTHATVRDRTPQSPYRPTASQHYRWGRVRYDFAWEHGQDLDSPPSKGDVRGGRWRDTSDGTGRATPFNGGLVLQSKLRHVGPGDRGTTTATMHGAAQRYGRWEFRLQGRTWETGAQPYRFRLELVPAHSEVTDCSPQSIVLADVTMGSPGLAFGVRSQSAGTVWQRRLAHVRLADQPFNVAVEVAKGHLTWFRDGKPIGSVTDDRAQLGVKLVPRLSLIGEPDVEMNGAQVNSDWQRSWTLRHGRQVTSRRALPSAPYSSC